MKLKELSPAFWADIWIREAQQSRLGRTQEQRPQAWKDFYGRTAPFWQEIRGCSGYSGDETAAILRAHNVLRPGGTLIDLGSGSGDFSIPAARSGLRVSAVDNCEEMLSQLRRRAAERGLSTIRTVPLAWEDLDGSETYDCVLAAFFPPAFSPQGFTKMERLSKKFCCIVFPLGEDPFPIRREIWRILLKEDPPARNFLLPCAFNYLESRGKQPSLIRLSRQAELNMDCKDLFHFYSAYFTIFGHSATKAEAVICSVLSDYENGGRVRCSGTEHTAVLWWEN